MRVSLACRPLQVMAEVGGEEKSWKEGGERELDEGKEA
jgi:hypothetical protein